MRRRFKSNWPVLVAPKLMQRQEELGLSYEDLMGLTGIRDITWLMEIIASDNSEVEAVYPVSVQKKVYEALQVNMLDVFEIECAFCQGDEGPWTELAALPRGQMLKKRREQLGLSFWGFAKRWGFARYFATEEDDQWVQRYMKMIGAFEDTPTSLDDLIFLEMVDLAEELEMPLQLLPGERCSKCGR